MMTGNRRRLRRFTADMAEGKMSEISQQTGTAGTEPKKHYSDQELSTVQERIVRGGRILRLGCRIARIVLIIMIVINLGLLITVFFNADAVKMAKEAFEDNALIQTISPLLISSGIGKLMIPSEILEKPGRLTDDEYAVIKTHTTYGGELLKNVEGEEMNLSRTIALQHHERVDGKGYPAQLSGEDISMEGKIVAVADVYDALTSKRSYKEAWKEEDAAAEIVKGSGTQFDARVVDAFRQAHDKILEVQQKYHD